MGTNCPPFTSRTWNGLRGTELPAVTGTAVYTAGNSVPSKPFQVLEVKGGQFVPIDKLDID